jgi:tetratricopeptide (TPR) repeat protein
LGIDPGSAKAQYNLGVLLLRAGGRTAEALSHLEAALRLRPDPELRRTVERLQAAQKAQK